MVDLNDIKSLEKVQRSNALPDYIRSWANYHKIPSGTRKGVVKRLYERYVGQPDKFVRKMLKSHTGIDDPERKVHEAIVRQYPEWDYEVSCTDEVTRYTIGSVDFYGNVEFEEIEGRLTCLIEVKDIASWKQVMVLSLYSQCFPCHTLVAAFFGKHPGSVKERHICSLLNRFNIHCFWVQEDGRLERFDSDIEYLEEF